MSRFILSYRLILKEPLVISNGSQIGNVLQTQDFIPGGTILGLCAGLHVKRGCKVKDDNGRYAETFRALFLSDRTIYSPAYPLSRTGEKTYPLPFSVFGCKYHGHNEPGNGDMHKFRDYLYLFDEVPEKCSEPHCEAPMEHKTGLMYFDEEIGEYCNFSPRKEILSHNQVGETNEEKRLFSFESLAPDQQFYGEISFDDESRREHILKLLAKTAAKIGKARNRGYGRVRFEDVRASDCSMRDSLSSGIENGAFSIDLFSDAILIDRTLRYCAAPSEEILQFWLGIESPEGITVHLKPDGEKRSFFKKGRVLGFNQHRKMPLPFDQTISRGSVITFSYTGTETIKKKLETLQGDGIGLRRNEGFGMVVINHKIHSQNPQIK